MNKINDLNSTIFESSQTFTSVTRIFSENSIQNSDSNEFDQLIEKIDFFSKKIDFADEKLTNFSSNIATKNPKQTNRKRKADQSSIWSRKISNSIKIIINLKDALENNLAKSN